MDQLELSRIRLQNLQAELLPNPEWAKAEKVEYSHSLLEIWQISRKPFFISLCRKLCKKTAE